MICSHHPDALMQSSTPGRSTGKICGCLVWMFSLNSGFEALSGTYYSGIESMYPMAPRGRNRDAHATFAGFVFQVNVTTLDWLELLPGQRLELEAGEDIDLIQEAAALGLNDLSRLQQVKQLRKKRLSLRSDDALEEIANFCEHRRSKPGQ